jgi:hypothetical protein
VADYRTFGIRNQRERKFSSFAQCANDEVLGVAGVRRIQKRGNRDCLNGAHVSGDLISDLHEESYLNFALGCRR